MPVTAFRVKNFMAFEDSGWVELRKINLLYGRNSYGKSVLIRALRLLRQSLTAAEDGGPLEFVDGSGVDVGSFKAVLHRSPQDKPIRFHKAFTQASSWSKPISFGFRCEIPLIEIRGRKEFEWAVLKDRLNTSIEGSISFEVSMSFSLNGEEVVVVGFDLWHYETTGWIGKTTRWLTLQFDPDIEPQWSGYSSTHLHNKSSDALASCHAIHCPDGVLPKIELSKIGITDISESEREQVSEIAQVWDFCKEEIAHFLQSIVYVAPIRPLPERYYLIDVNTRQSLRKQGGQAFLEYLESTESISLQKRIERWMKEFDLATSIRHNPSTSHQTPDHLVAIRELVISECEEPKDIQANRVEVNIKDIGFGASQILPVIISCLTAPEDAFVIVEQPELHLHPEAQAATADLFIECVDELSEEEKIKEGLETRDKERNENNGGRVARDDRVKKRVSRRCLIETHSEHLLLMLQRRIAETVLNDLKSDGKRTYDQKPVLYGKDFGLLFITRKRNEGKSKIEHIEIDHLGLLDDPSVEFRKFFERDYKDSAALSMTVAKASSFGGDR